MSNPQLPETSETATKPAEEAAKAPDRIGYWKANVRLIAALLCVWATVSYGCGILFIETLNQWSLGGVPLGFWFAQQGSIYVFIVLIAIYAIGMDLLDRRYGVKQEQV